MNPPKAYLYLLIAFFGVYLGADKMPENWWAWSKLLAGCLVAGANALKALQSIPDPPPAP